eukprot:1122356-Amphidinium_carterae.1
MEILTSATDPLAAAVCNREQPHSSLESLQFTLSMQLQQKLQTHAFKYLDSYYLCKVIDRLFWGCARVLKH